MGNDLSTLQEWMASALVQRKPVAEVAELAKETPKHIAGNSRLSPVEQLEIYRDQFWIRHLDAMYEDYESLAKTIGWDDFEDLCAAYFAAHPPQDFSLRDLGKRFPDFLEEVKKDDRLLVDIARTEWAFVEAFDGPDAPPLDPSSLATASEDDWPRARIVFHPSMQRLRLEYPTHEHREAVRTGREATRPEPKKVNVVVYRGPQSLHYVEIAEDELALVEELSKGTPLGEACERAMKRAGVTDVAAFEGKIGQWFQLWAGRGWVSAVKFADASGTD
jgi:hypothetical protein